MSHQSASQRRRLTVAALSVLVTVAVAGCTGSSSDGDLPERLQKITPSESPSPVFAHSAKAQIDARQVQGDGWTIQVPANFEEQTAPGTNESTTYRWIPPTAGQQPPLVAVITDKDPRADAIEQSKTLEVTTETDPKVEVSRSQITWPGAQRAILLQWTAPQQGSGKNVTTWQLMVQVNSKLILNALAIAPEDECAKFKFAEVLSTFTPKA